MGKISWGIIGCGDVTEIKSGPAFNKVENSQLIAVMRRDGEKAKDYAHRHGVPKWYTDARRLIDDPDVNAIYIATPPSSHEEYTLVALEAGKPVYVEKPMTVDAASALRMAKAAKERNVKLSVAHYRRAQPLFSKIKQLLDEKIIGEVRFVRSEIYKRPLSKTELSEPKIAWRVDPSVAGGGLFHDLSPHQLDLMYYYFGMPAIASGISINQAKLYAADDLVAAHVLFGGGVLCDGLWCFSVAAGIEKDYCEIAGEKGKISFSFFENRPVSVTLDGKTEIFLFDPLAHVQQPMIQKVVEYFLDAGPNPCSGEEGAVVMKLIDDITLSMKREK